MYLQECIYFIVKTRYLQMIYRVGENNLSLRGTTGHCHRIHKMYFANIYKSMKQDFVLKLNQLLEFTELF